MEDHQGATVVRIRLNLISESDPNLVWGVVGVGCFAVAMGYMEAAVVVYLRELYYPAGFHVLTEAALKAIPRAILLTEVGREVATIVILISVSMLLGRRDWVRRFAYFLFAFALWDITYYVWLFVLIRWPQSLLTNDVLFLIPRPWLGPVIAPIVVSLTFAVIALLLLTSGKEITSFRGVLKMWRYWVYLVIAVWIIISAFILWEQRTLYLWNNVIIGLAIALFTILVAIKKVRS
jgi:hypothetical protein